ncbi:hypothetical protein [Paraburkholderia sp. J11-2]|uniref:hypothetical protein n=1 Tax=Paraburkholderia sp. J11-2 TaxID=2805431 RepID=UPI002AB7DEFB|nr:hypothetical protein [Paraburkholderia sp. J11-2]
MPSGGAARAHREPAGWLSFHPPVKRRPTNRIPFFTILLFCALSIPLPGLANGNSSSVVTVESPFALTGLVAGQTLRLGVVNLTAKQSSPTSCVATLGFVDGQGQVLPVNGVPTTSVSLASGASTFLDFQAPANATGFGGRFPIRPVVTSNSAACVLSASTEIFDSAAGVTRVAYPPQPILPPGSLGPLNLFGLKWVGPGQVARFTASNISTTAVKGDSCLIQLGYVDAAGKALTNADGLPLVTQAALTPGASTTLELQPSIGGQGATGLTPVVQRLGAPPLLAAQCQVALGLEVLDGATGATQVFQPQDPTIFQPFAPFRPQFAVMGLVAGQSMRLSVLNVTPALGSGRTCPVTIGFVDDQNHPLAVNGAPTTSISLASGAAASIDMPASDSAVGLTTRTLVRPVVTSNSPLCLLRASANLIDRASGATLVAYPPDPIYPSGPVFPPDPIFPPVPVFPPGPVVPQVNPYGLAGLGAGQLARLSAVNVSTGTASCPVQLSYVDAQGQPVTNADGQPLVSSLSLSPGASASLDVRNTTLAPGSIDNPGVLNQILVRPVVQPVTQTLQCQIAIGLEVIDTSSGATKLFYPPDPVLPQVITTGQ